MITKELLLKDLEAIRDAAEHIGLRVGAEQDLLDNIEYMEIHINDMSDIVLEGGISNEL